MNTRHVLRLGGFAALAFVVLTMTAHFLPGDFLADRVEDPLEVTAFFERNAAMQALQPLTKVAAAFALLVVGGAFAIAFREHGQPLLATATIATATLFAGVIIMIMLFVSAIVALAPSLDGAFVHAAYFTIWTANVRSGLAALPLLVTVGWGIVRTRAIPRAFGYAALAVAALGVAAHASAVFLPGDASAGPAFVSLLLVVVWALVAGVGMIARGGKVDDVSRDALAAARAR